MRSPTYRNLCLTRSNGGKETNVAASDDLTISVSFFNDARIRQQTIELYDDLRPSLYAYLSCLGLSADQAQDVIQETFLRLVRHRFQQSGEDNLRAWIFRVAHNLSIDFHRFQRRWYWNSDNQPRGPLNQQIDPRPSPEQRVILKEHRKRIEDAFAQLTPKQRQCVVLRAEGFRYREIALILRISVQRVGELMKRSIDLLEVHP